MPHDGSEGAGTASERWHASEWDQGEPRGGLPASEIERREATTTIGADRGVSGLLASMMPTVGVLYRYLKAICGVEQ